MWLTKMPRARPSGCHPMPAFQGVSPIELSGTCFGIDMRKSLPGVGLSWIDSAKGILEAVADSQRLSKPAREGRGKGGESLLERHFQTNRKPH